MKKILAIFVMMLLVHHTWSQGSMKDLYVNWIIEDTQRGKYREAFNNLDKIQDYPEDYVIWLNNLMEEAWRNDAADVMEEAFQKLSAVPIDYHTYRSLGNCASIFANKGEYSKCLTYYNRQLSILRKNPVLNEEEYGHVMTSIAATYKRLGLQEKADSANMKALLHYGEKYEGRFSADYMFLLINIGDIYQRNHEYQNGLLYYKKAVNIARSMSTDLISVIAFQSLGMAYMHINMNRESINTYKEAELILDKIADKTSNRYKGAQYNIYDMLALNYKQVHNYSNAIFYYEKAIAIAEELYGVSSNEYLYDNVSLAQIFVNNHSLDNAQNILLPIIEMMEKQNKPNDELLISFYSEAAHMYAIALDFENEVLFRKKEMERIKFVHGENSATYASALVMYANANYSTYTYEESIKCFRKACEIEYNLHGKSLLYLEYLTNLATSYRLNGQNSQALAEYEKILNLCESSPDSKATKVRILNNLGLMNFEDLITAERYFREALVIGQCDNSANSRSLLSTYNNLGLLYMHNGMYKESEKFLLKAYEVSQIPFDTIYGYGMGLSYASVLKNLAELYIYLEDLEKAKDFSQEALKQCISTNGLNTNDHAVILHLMGDIETLYNNPQGAIRMYEQALEIRKKIYGSSSEQCALTFGAIGGAYHFLGDYKRAIEFYQKEKTIISSLKRDLFIVNSNLSYSEWLLGDNKSSVQDLNASLNSLETYLRTFFVNLSEKQREQYWAQYQQTTIPVTYNIVFDAWKSNLRSEKIAYRMALLSKGVLLDVQKQKIEYIKFSPDNSLREKWNLWTAKMKKLQDLIEKQSDISRIAEITRQCEELDKEISNKLPPYYNTISIADIQSHIPQNAVAIEFIDFTVMKKRLIVANSDSTIYCALLLRNQSKCPELIPLFEEKEVLSLINTANENQTSHTYSYDGNGEQLSKLVWSKILPYIKKGETIYFAPSGLLHQLAIESLPYDEEHTMADMFNLVRLSSTREIVTHKNDTQHSSAALYGGIQYDVDTDELLTESEKYSSADLLASRGIESDTLDRGSIKYLKGTKTEVENINSMLLQNNLQVQLFTSTNANEESFKALSGKYQNILHIATHGFFWTDSTAQKKEYFAQRMLTLDTNMPSPQAIDPLNRCGLLFAGAQTAWSGHRAELPEGVQDGILTAKEISLLDLRDADLVVLSACETGKGEITSDGVFGLQRAFKQAGAQTIIMSLWPVNDAATQLLMTEFYRNWITNHQSKRKAFRNAQNTVRCKYEEPVYWAGFIMLD